MALNVETAATEEFEPSLATPSVGVISDRLCVTSEDVSIKPVFTTPGQSTAMASPSPPAVFFNSPCLSCADESKEVGTA